MPFLDGCVLSWPMFPALSAVPVPPVRAWLRRVWGRLPRPEREQAYGELVRALWASDAAGVRQQLAGLGTSAGSDEPRFLVSGPQLRVAAVSVAVQALGHVVRHRRTLVDRPVEHRIAAARREAQARQCLQALLDAGFSPDADAAVHPAVVTSALLEAAALPDARTVESLLKAGASCHRPLVGVEDARRSVLSVALGPTVEHARVLEVLVAGGAQDSPDDEVLAQALRAQFWPSVRVLLACGWSTRVPAGQLIWPALRAGVPADLAVPLDQWGEGWGPSASWMFQPWSAAVGFDRIRRQALALEGEIPKPPRPVRARF